MKLKSLAFNMWIFVNVIYTLRVEQRRATFDAVNIISFFEKEFREIGSVLACDACDQCFFYN